MVLINKLCFRLYSPINILTRSVANGSAAASTANYSYFNQEHMRAWTVPSFGTLDHLQLADNMTLPVIKHPNDILIKVYAASVNPVDVLMVAGYGNTLLSAVRQCDYLINRKEESDSCTFIPGRDFSGEVLAKGSGVRPDIKIGDLVYGVVPAHHQGCHAEMVVASESMVRHIPEGTSLTDAAALLYCGLTSWSALCITGDLFWSSREGKKVLVIGGAGGVGSLAVQMLKAWNVEVTATCRTDAIPLLESLGVNTIIDYTAADAMKKIEQAGKYDIILNAAGKLTHYTYIPFLKNWSNSKYITLSSPLLANTDKYGLVPGMIKNAAELLRSNILSGAPQKGTTIRWGYFLPLESGVDELHSLFCKDKIRPIINKVYLFSELPKAYENVKSGHNRGKIVISMDEMNISKEKNIE